MSWYHPSSLFDKIFEGGILIKGLHGLLEFIGGLLLIVISPDKLHSYVVNVTQDRLLDNPHDAISHWLLHTTASLGGNRTFLISYLWIHAFIKLIAVGGILLNKLWAYPFSLIGLGLFMIYQIYEIILRQSIGLILLTLFDVFILWLIWREWGKVKQQGLPADKPAAD